MAERNKDFVIGFICQSRLSTDPDLIHMMPGMYMGVAIHIHYRVCLLREKSPVKGLHFFFQNKTSDLCPGS